MQLTNSTPLLPCRISCATAVKARIALTNDGTSYRHCHRWGITTGNHVPQCIQDIFQLIVLNNLYTVEGRAIALIELENEINWLKTNYSDEYDKVSLFIENNKTALERLKMKILPQVSPHPIKPGDIGVAPEKGEPEFSATSFNYLKIYKPKDASKPKIANFLERNGEITAVFYHRHYEKGKDEKMLTSCITQTISLFKYCEGENRIFLIQNIMLDIVALEEISTSNVEYTILLNQVKHLTTKLPSRDFQLPISMSTVPSCQSPCNSMSIPKLSTVQHTTTSVPRQTLVHADGKITLLHTFDMQEPSISTVNFDGEICRRIGHSHPYLYPAIISPEEKKLKDIQACETKLSSIHDLSEEEKSSIKLVHDNLRQYSHVDPTYREK